MMGARRKKNANAFQSSRPRPRPALPLNLFSSTSTPSTPTLTLNLNNSAGRSDGSSGFTAGFILGGVVFGALGFLFAPQISSALLSDDQSRLKLPRFLDDEAGGDGGNGARRGAGQPMTKQDLADRIAQLNSAIDDVSAQLRAQDEAAAEVAAAGEGGEAAVAEAAA